ncbi:MAG TPA: exosortase H-associated membrane protein [Usitatibacter sp.]|nr:exosortase H-associated membrane protein [Usitatibacter sp.]
MQREGLGAFVLRTFLWLPPCIGAWYLVAGPHGLLAGWLAQPIAGAFSPDLVTAVELQGRVLAFVTRLTTRTESGETGVLVPEVNPLVYTYGLAFFMALMLAARPRFWPIVAGALALLPFQAWGIAFDLLAQVGVRLGPEVAAQARLGGWELEVIALGFQLGSLILPPVVPVLLWAGLNRAFLERVLRSREA